MTSNMRIFLLMAQGATASRFSKFLELKEGGVAPFLKGSRYEPT